MNRHAAGGWVPTRPPGVGLALISPIELSLKSLRSPVGSGGPSSGAAAVHEPSTIWGKRVIV